ncbi:MAG: hypothetical protein LBN95_04750 [Prevotellaceae bacterium]|jgi:hypothetical protein|nr:hypothetical protein [Prevotellaceae bacterium]
MKKVFIFAAAVAIGMSACNKAELADNNLPVKQKATFAPVSANIRVFNSVDELTYEINKVLSMPLTDLCDYETSIGFNSFGKLADLAYQEVAVNEDNYKSVAEVANVIKGYSEYLQLLEDSTGITCETKLHNTPLRYIINDNQIYQMKDSLAKVLDSATIFTSVANYAILLNIGDDEIADISNNIVTNYKENSLVVLGSVVTNRETYDIVSVNGNIMYGPLDPIIIGPTHPFPNGNSYQCSKPSPNLGDDFGVHYDYQSNGSSRWKRLAVEVYMVQAWDKTYYACEKITSKRKGLANIIWWQWGRNINYDIGITGWSSYYCEFSGSDRNYYPNEWKVEKMICSFNNNPLYKPCYTETRGFAETQEVRVTFNYHY